MIATHEHVVEPVLVVSLVRLHHCLEIVLLRGVEACRGRRDETANGGSRGNGIKEMHDNDKMAMKQRS